MSKRLVVKFGGSVLQDDTLLQTICNDMAVICRAGVELVVVHGGGPAINEELVRRNIQWSFVEGLRVTTPEMMNVIEMVLCGQVNKRIVRALQRAGAKSVGFSGVDGATLICRKADERLGQVGIVEHVDTKLVEAALALENEEGVCGIPVIAPVGVGREGSAYNINADWVAARIASTLEVSKLIFLTDQDGVLDSTKNLISELAASELEELIERRVVKDGMLAKVRTILHALQNRVSSVHVLNARRPRVLIDEVLGSGALGTICTLTPKAYRNDESLHAVDGF